MPKLGLGLSIAKSFLLSSISSIINAFKARVLADGGTFEGETNLLNQNINNIKDASFVFIPSGYKSGKAYSVKPIDGSGDLTFSRASIAYRYDNNNLLELVGNNIPRISFVNNIPTLLLEPIRTNILATSNDFTSYVKDNSTVVGNVLTENTANSAHRLETPFFSGHTINTLHTFSALVKQRTGTRNVSISVSNGTTGDVVSQTLNLQTGVLSNAITTGTADWTNLSNRVSLVPGGYFLFELTGQSSSGTSRKIRVNMLNGDVGTYLGDGTSAIEVSHFQSEAANCATSRILTTGAAATRLGETVNGVVSFSANVGSVFIDIAPTVSATGLNNFLFKMGDIEIRGNTINWALMYDNANLGGYTSSKTIRTKFLLTFNGSQIKAFINGVVVAEVSNRTTLVAPANFSINPTNGAFSFPLYSLMTFNRTLSIPEGIALTTL
jgi:hypothetical protein